jgi:hypothetical protein
MKSKKAKTKYSSNALSHCDTMSPFSSQQLTAAELMRQKLRREERATKAPSDAAKEKDVDIDEEIKRLEAELAGDTSGSGSDDSSDSDFNSGDEDDEAQNNPPGSLSSGVLCLSACAQEKIAPLPKDALPTVKSKKLKVDLKDEEIRNESTSRKRKTSKAKKEHSNNSSTEHLVVSDGLVAAVKDVLSGYVARSSEKIPFYCRVCSHQSNSEEEFRQHRESEFHKAAVQVEKKATYCKLCRKQLTSLVQMQEHLASRPHREKMNSVKSRQRGASAGRGGRSDGGRFDYSGKSRRQSDKRQWV